MHTVTECRPAYNYRQRQAIMVMTSMSRQGTNESWVMRYPSPFTRWSPTIGREVNIDPVLGQFVENAIRLAQVFPNGRDCFGEFQASSFRLSRSHIFRVTSQHTISNGPISHGGRKVEWTRQARVGSGSSTSAPHIDARKDRIWRVEHVPA